jgi:hypothetical protein
VMRLDTGRTAGAQIARARLRLAIQAVQASLDSAGTAYGVSANSNCSLPEILPVLLAYLCSHNVSTNASLALDTTMKL